MNLGRLEHVIGFDEIILQGNPLVYMLFTRGGFDGCNAAVYTSTATNDYVVKVEVVGHNVT